ncbi:MAG: hypothetical protein HYX75_15355 [Acidobacteria bacterium]|nr:hypothetical protein [Acidobacteriota bacterium]
MTSAQAYSGYILVIDEPPRAELLRTIAEESRSVGRRFTDAISALDQKPKSAEIFLLSAEEGAFQRRCPVGARDQGLRHHGDLDLADDSAQRFRSACRAAGLFSLRS